MPPSSFELETSSLNDKPYLPIIEFSERLLTKHGDSPAGVGWKSTDANARYRVMLDVIRPGSLACSLLDFGCGAGHLLEYIRQEKLLGIHYHGLDMSARAISLCRRKFPTIEFFEVDVLAPDAPIVGRFDYVVMNGIFTYKGTLSDAEMYDYCRTLLRAVFDHTDVGLAFNVMSKQVDWERDDLFHMPMDPMVAFLSRELSRHLVIRADYGLYEYTVHVYRDPIAGAMPDAQRPVSRHES